VVRGVIRRNPAAVRDIPQVLVKIHQQAWLTKRGVLQVKETTWVRGLETSLEPAHEPSLRVHELLRGGYRRWRSVCLPQERTAATASRGRPMWDPTRQPDSALLRLHEHTAGPIGIRATTGIRPRERREAASREALVRRVSVEYRDMPGLCLTLAQAQRLFGLREDLCVRSIRSYSRRSCAGTRTARSLRMLTAHAVRAVENGGLR
jgi:hypothetical protein